MNDSSPDTKALCCVSYFVRQMMNLTYSPESNPCLSLFPIHFSNKNNDMVHFHERKLLDNFKEITMEKGCLQNIMRFMR